MALHAASSSNGQTIELPSGTSTGHVLVRHHDVTIAGPTPGDATAAVLKADGHYPSLLQTPFPVQTSDGKPVSKLTVRDVTLDGDLVSTLTCLVGGAATAGPLEIVLENVILRRTHKNAIAILNTTDVDAEDVTIIGNGGGVNAAEASTRTRLRRVTVHGGRYALLGAGAGIDVEDLRGTADYWACPTFETCEVTAFGDIYVDVESHVQANRSLYDVLRALTPLGTFAADDPGAVVAGARPWDRVEVEDGRWAQVLGVRFDGVLRLDTWREAGGWYPASTPSSTATLYRVSLGRLYGSTATRLQLRTNQGIPGYARWRGVEGGLMQPELVEGARLDILRHGLGGAAAARDVDSGIVHVTQTATQARLRKLRCRGGFSDIVTVRGKGTTVYDARVRLGQDMGFTVDGTMGRQTLDLCVAEQTGFNGFTMLGGPSDVRSSFAIENGTHGDGYGVVVQSEASGSRVDVSARANASGDVHAPWIAHAMHARHLLTLARTRGVS